MRARADVGLRRDLLRNLPDRPRGARGRAGLARVASALVGLRHGVGVNRAELWTVQDRLGEPAFNSAMAIVFAARAAGRRPVCFVRYHSGSSFQVARASARSRRSYQRCWAMTHRVRHGRACPGHPRI